MCNLKASVYTCTQKNNNNFILYRVVVAKDCAPTSDNKALLERLFVDRSAVIVVRTVAVCWAVAPIYVHTI